MFVRDRQAGTTERVSVDSSGRQTNNASNSPDISADGRFVVFASTASNLVPGDTNVVRDVFVRDRQAGTTERVSVSADGSQGDGPSPSPGIRGGTTFGPAISADGSLVAFDSSATNLVAGDTNTCVNPGDTNACAFPAVSFTDGHCPNIFAHTR